ncbi:hypothetical protein AUEXF2481DRAFT_630793 [Aureobasidium subglaciale EXF-2481]|uniref:AMP-activated protein kinase glycogen-binding domain-containing protein n=1 Tax=Aureobasidium subglaciale (strain EXF-2481) TaxID=1043005 RepID=A0A074ZER4_AURSE|nr:uncharacterized protein AUEXF2481DRAFT_630793 [Aureobasidium subglaciale EXF-2481]KEQ97111.1 hypothetical protein AUEXF2481DRAFT_630793 [Aureobasidium subglaciale EXF-2481]
MAQKHEILYSHPGLQPPVFIAGSMCEPQWEPIEMAYEEKADGELEFKHEFKAQPGQYQYKFRLGPGDWWVLDETKPTVDDGTGIRNNHYTVEAEIPKHEVEKAPQAQVSHTTKEMDTPAPAHTAEQKPSVPEIEDDDEIPESEKNLFRHETIQIADGSGQSDKEDQQDQEDEDNEEPPLLEHEAGPYQRVDSQHVTPFKTDNFVFDEPVEHAIDVDDFADDERDAPCPLFRHETGAASDIDPDEAPLFRHESISPLDPMSTSPLSPSSRKQRNFDFQDVNDPSLEPFPVDEAGIQARIQRAATRRREDDDVFDGTPPSPSLAQTKSFSPQARPELPHHESSDLSHLDAIDETEETDDEDEAPAVKLVGKKDSLVHPTPINIKVQDVSEIANIPSFADVPEISNQGPPTPPMTPTEHARSKAAPHDGASDSKEQPAQRGDRRSREDNVTDHIANRPSPREIAEAEKKGESVDAAKNGKPSKSSTPKQSMSSMAFIWFVGLCGGKQNAAGVAIAMSVAAVALAMNSRSG